MSRSYEGGTQIARKLKPAITELEEAGFLLPLPEQERFIKKGREWSIRLIQKTGPLPGLPDPSQDEQTPSEHIAELTKRGVTDTTAAELVKQHAAEKIQAKIEEFDWLVANWISELLKTRQAF